MLPLAFATAVLLAASGQPGPFPAQVVAPAADPAPARAGFGPVQRPSSPSHDITITPDGTAWTTSGLGSLVVARAQPDGRFGPTVERDLGGVVNDAALADDGSGVAIVADLDDAKPSELVSFGADGRPGDRFSLGRGQLADVDVAPDGSAVATWRQRGKVLVTVRTPGGSFSTPRVFGRAGTQVIEPVAADGGDGLLQDVRFSDDGPGSTLIRIVRSGRVGPLQRLTGDHVEAAMGPDGTVAVAQDDRTTLRATTVLPADDEIGPLRTLDTRTGDSPQDGPAEVAVGPEGAVGVGWLREGRFVVHEGPGLRRARTLGHEDGLLLEGVGGRAAVVPSTFEPGPAGKVTIRTASGRVATHRSPQRVRKGELGENHPTAAIAPDGSVLLGVLVEERWFVWRVTP